MLYVSSLPLILKLLATIYLIYSFLKNQNDASPSSLHSVLFQSGKWTIELSGKDHTFEKHRVILEAGICFLLEFINANERKIFVVFFDQLSVDNYRQLKLIEKIS